LAGEANTSQFVIEPLGSKHDRAAFSCGVDSLNVYLRKQAGEDLKKCTAVSFVLTTDGKTIAGYYTLSQYAVQLENVPEHLAKKLPKYPMVPTTLIGRLAVDSASRGQRHGETLLMDALYRISFPWRRSKSCFRITKANKNDHAGVITSVAWKRQFRPAGVLDSHASFPESRNTAPLANVILSAVDSLVKRTQKNWRR